MEKRYDVLTLENGKSKEIITNKTLEEALEDLTKITGQTIDFLKGRLEKEGCFVDYRIDLLFDTYYFMLTEESKKELKERGGKKNDLISEIAEKINNRYFEYLPCLQVMYKTKDEALTENCVKKYLDKEKAYKLMEELRENEDLRVIDYRVGNTYFYDDFLKGIK